MKKNIYCFTPIKIGKYDQIRTSVSTNKVGILLIISMPYLNYYAVFKKIVIRNQEVPRLTMGPKIEPNQFHQYYFMCCNNNYSKQLFIENR